MARNGASKILDYTVQDAGKAAHPDNVEGKMIAELLGNLTKKYPAMSERIDQGIAVAFDGGITPSPVNTYR